MLRAANKANCFYTLIEKTVKKQAVADGDREWWLDSDEKDEAEPTTMVKHYVALPSIVFSKSENPDHKYHLRCLARPPLEKHEEDQLKLDNYVLLKMTR